MSAYLPTSESMIERERESESEKEPRRSSIDLFLFGSSGKNSIDRSIERLLLALLLSCAFACLLGPDWFIDWCRKREERERDRQQLSDKRNETICEELRVFSYIYVHIIYPDWWMERSSLACVRRAASRLLTSSSSSFFLLEVSELPRFWREVRDLFVLPYCTYNIL